jgi:hypothetical protein
MSEAQLSTRPTGLTFGTAVWILVLILLGAIPICWLAQYHYGVSAEIASNIQIGVFIPVYAGILLLPWLNLHGQEHLSRAQRLEKMCVAWCCLTVVPHVTGELSYILFYPEILAHKTSLLTYCWWTYFYGGDARYLKHDILIVVLETGAVAIGLTVGTLLLSYRKRHRFTDIQLVVLMGASACDGYSTLIYYLTEMLRGFPNETGGLVDLLIKFVGSNSFWLFMPWVVFIWAGKQLMRRRYAAVA